LLGLQFMFGEHGLESGEHGWVVGEHVPGLHEGAG
jgi:hypothetical protein